MTESLKRQSCGSNHERGRGKRGRGRVVGRRRGRGGRASVQQHVQRSSGDHVLSSSAQSQQSNLSGTKNISDPTGEVDDIAQLKSTIVDLKKKMEESATRSNELKNEKFALKNDVMHKDNQILYLQVENTKLQKQIREEKQLSDGLRSLNAQLEAKMSTRVGGSNMKSFFKRLEKTIDKRYLSLACSVERHVSKLLPSETMEIEYTVEEKKVRKWDCRMEVVSEHGIEIKNRQTGKMHLIVPTFFEKVMLSRDSFYLPSFVSNEVVLRTVVLEVLLEPEWVNFRTTEEVKTETVTEISTNAVMLANMRQKISDSISGRKRNSRDELFQQLHYFSLKSAHDKRRESPLFSKVEEIRRAKKNLLKIVDGEVDYSWWRTANITELSVNGEDTVGCDSKHFERDEIAPIEDDVCDSTDRCIDHEDVVQSRAGSSYDHTDGLRDDWKNDSEHFVSCFGILRNEISKHIYCISWDMIHM